MAGSHAIMAGKTVSESYNITSGYYEFTAGDPKGGGSSTEYYWGYSTDTSGSGAFAWGTSNNNTFNVKNNSGNVIISTSSTSNNNAHEIKLYFRYFKGSGSAFVNNGWSIIKIYHPYTNTTWKYNRRDALFETTTTEVNGAYYTWNLGILTASTTPFKNQTSGQSTYIVDIV